MRQRWWSLGLALMLGASISSTASTQEREAKRSAKDQTLFVGCPPLPHTQSLEATPVRGPRREVHVGFHPDSREACVGVILSDGSKREVASATLALEKNHSNIGYIAPVLYPQPIYHDEEQLIFAIALPSRRAARQTWSFWRIDGTSLENIGAWTMLEETEAGLKAGQICGPFDRIQQTHIDAKANVLKLSACKGGEYAEVHAFALSSKGSPERKGPLVPREEGLVGCPASTSTRDVPVRAGTSYKVSLGWSEGAEKACVAAILEAPDGSKARAAGSIPAGYLARYDEYVAPTIEDVILATDEQLVFTSVSSWMGRRVEDGGTRVDVWQVQGARIEYLGGWAPESLASCKLAKKPWALSKDRKKLTLETCRGKKKHREVFELKR